MDLLWRPAMGGVGALTLFKVTGSAAYRRPSLLVALQQRRVRALERKHGHQLAQVGGLERWPTRVERVLPQHRRVVRRDRPGMVEVGTVGSLSGEAPADQGGRRHERG